MTDVTDSVPVEGRVFLWGNDVMTLMTFMTFVWRE
jgi:hypothetical protein